jgi:alpha-L-rhamnosidase
MKYFTLSIVFLSAAALAQTAASSIRPATLRCEYRVNPQGIDEREPRVSWILLPAKLGMRGLKQSAYQIEAASSETNLRAGKADLWTSGKVNTSESTHIAYSGKPLESGQQVFWRVLVWDQDGRESAWSEGARWSMGLLSQGDWKGKWIGWNEPDGYHHPESVYHHLEQSHWIGSASGAQNLTFFRTSFSIPAGRKVRRAIVLMGAEARFEFFLNGTSLIRGTDVMMPSFLDITPEIKAGQNTVAVRVVGPPDPPPGDFVPHVAKRPMALIGVIRVEFDSGDPLSIATSSSWKSADQESPGDSGWAAAKDAGAYGVQPWGDVGFKEERALPARMLRKEFAVHGGLKRATAYVSGLGLSEFYLNGRKVGDHVLSPGLTDYRKRVQYVTYDVTDRLVPGQNAAGLILGNGRYWAPRVGVALPAVSFGYPKARCQIEVEYADGGKQVVATGDEWKLTRDGPIRANSEYDGESYDARREIAGWSKPGFDDSKWEGAQLVEGPAGRLVAQMAEPLRVVETIKPAKVTEPRPGVFIFDMDQNMVGWCRLKVAGPKGTEVRLRHAETLQADGMLYLDNLRSARALDHYVLKGAGLETWEPRFTYHGFRFVEVRGYPGKPPLTAIEGKVVHDDMSRTADFRSSDELLNKLHHNIYWGVRGNYRSIPTDCPQRDERQGWLGDRSMVSRSESYLFDIAAFYTKWHHDLEDSQNDEGLIPDVSPAFWPLYTDDVTWPSTFLLVPGMLFEQYGDKRVIVRAYPAMRKWVEHMRGSIKDGLLSKDTFGDWCVPPENPKLIHSEDPARRTDKTLVATAYFQYLLRLMARYANIAGQEQDAKDYEALSRHMQAAFQKKFFQADKAIYDNGSQTSSLLPLALGITPDDLRPKVLASLTRKIEGESNGHIGVGLIGAQWLMRTLSDNGETDLAYKIATQKDYPGWGYMVQQGATTVWELWNGNTADPAMNSGNHVMQIGDLGIWMYAYLGGIRADPEHPGFERSIIEPVIPKDLKFVEVSHQSMYGKIASSWKRTGQQLSFHVTVPPNTTALVYVPSKDGSVTESGKAAEKAAGVKFLRREGQAAVFEVGSGDFAFQSNL